MIAELIMSAWFMGVLLGRYDTALEMPAAEQSVVAQFAEVQWGPLDPDDAIEWFRNKLSMTPAMRQIVGKYLAEEGRSLDDYRDLVFTIGKIERLRLLQLIQDSLRVALEHGTTFREWKSQSSDAFAQAGYTQADPWHIETIFRTNLFSAYNAGRYKQGIATADLLPYWQYKAVLDGRTRTTHRMMNNFIARKDDQIWNIWFPPNGFNCRCTVISLSAERAAREDRGMPPSGMPDEGFDRNPGKPDPADRQVLLDLLSKAGEQYEEGWQDV